MFTPGSIWSDSRKRGVCFGKAGRRNGDPDLLATLPRFLCRQELLELLPQFGIHAVPILTKAPVRGESEHPANARGRGQGAGAAAGGLAKLNSPKILPMRGELRLSGVMQKEPCASARRNCAKVT